MIYALLGYIAAGMTAIFMRKPTPSILNERELYSAGYNTAIRDAGEILRDVRIECGIGVGENPVLEEIFTRLRACRK